MHPARFSGKLNYMKKVSLYLIAILTLIGGFYLFEHRGEYSWLSWLAPIHPVEGEVQTHRSASLKWRAIDKTAAGFKLEMPGEPKQSVVEATTDSGDPEPVSMLMVKPDAQSAFAIAWAEKPPVARVNDLLADKTLDQARDGAMARTQSTLISETRSTPQGYPGREVMSRNVGGGILDTRFIYAGTRLYMLIATSPSESARREDAIQRFFNSFAIAGNTQVPETLSSSNE